MDLDRLIRLNVTCVVGWWNRDSLPGDLEVLNALALDPKQKKISQAPFTVSESGVDYRVEPLFDYELYGLVVSKRNHDGNRMLHRLWNDHLNVADLCVVWGNQHRPHGRYQNGRRGHIFGSFCQWMKLGGSQINHRFQCRVHQLSCPDQ